jgi:signal transduction histidine kinase
MADFGALERRIVVARRKFDGEWLARVRAPQSVNGMALAVLASMRRRPLGFEARLGIASTVVMAVVSMGLSWQLARGVLGDLRAHLTQRGRSVIATIVPDAVETLEHGDLDALAKAAERAHAQGDVIAVRVFDPGGLLLVATGTRTGPAVSVPPPHDLATETREIDGVGLDLWDEIVRTDGVAGRLGTVEVVVSTAPLDALRRRILTTAAFLTVLFMAIGAVAALGMARALTRPLADLARATAAIAEGDFSARVAVRRKDELGTVAAAFNVMATNLAHSHRALESKVRELERADRLKSEFLATVSHELRTPLNVIIGNAEMLADPTTRTSAEHGDLVATIRRYAELQLDLVTSVLDFERLASGEVTCARERFAVAPLVEDVLALQRTHVRPGVQLAGSVSSDCGELETDRTKVHQILRNLVDNAIKFTESGRVLVEVGPAPAEERVVIAVTDTGPGVPADELPHIFEPFHQLGPSSTRRTGGVGLGLSIVQRLTHALGGEVTVSSEPGWGSTFRVELPRRAPDATRAVPVREAAHGRHARGRRAA